MVYEGLVDPAMLGVLTRMNGATPLRHILAELAASVGMDLDKLMPRVMPIVRDQLARGYVTLWE